ncbi:MAG: phosphoribosyltransferase family protein [Bacteroidota bacterium]|nr:phosphoribosyltransferase family protein [Bacteroidota bacterium]
MAKFQFISLFFDLVFPRSCAACGTSMVMNEKFICTQCLLELPKTNFHNHENNPVAQSLWGRINVENATAYYFFEKGSKFKNLIHNIKYKGQKELGLGLGKLFGQELKHTKFSLVDEIIPVPLHSRKKRKRGFNQSEWIAQGLAENLGKSLNTKQLYRAKANPTQTNKSRYERWENVEGIFKLKDPESLKGKHILLVDDVLTTGSTIEACAYPILEIEGTHVSLAVLAYAL